MGGIRHEIKASTVQSATHASPSGREGVDKRKKQKLINKQNIPQLVFFGMEVDHLAPLIQTQGKGPTYLIKVSGFEFFSVLVPFQLI
jgi:hypothetical protein